MSVRTGGVAALVVLGALAALARTAEAHPHVFAESRMEIVGNAEAQLVSVRNIWRFDELFSSSVVVDFDKNGNGTLDPDEIEAVSATVLQSIAEWDFYTFVTVAGRDIKLEPPKQIRGLFDHGQLTLLFEMAPAEPVDLKKQPVTFSAYDESYFVAFDFTDETAYQLLDLPKTCRKTFTQPDPDADASDWMNSVSMLKPNQALPSDGVNYSQLLATRVDVQCAH
ncbi:DUF1007 family protein [Aureimonas sp. AU12]|uniref:DUF1007 family protein n=1 Tax=Aureimonas sp. AU12 TaxID=1638161 RepID=UPI0007836C11|nr:DUF1007 family protein [Aureimonas sp. AU12]